MEFRYKINKEIILYADMVENVTKGQLIKKSKNYYDTFLEASKHVITFAYEEQTNLEAMREHYKNKNDLLNINSNEVNDLKDKINLLNPQIIKDVSRKSGFDEYYQKSIAKEKKCKSKLSIIENLLAQHEKTRQRMMDLEQKYHDAPFKTVVLTIGENKELNENVNKLSEFKKNIEDMDKNKIDNERKEMNDRGIRKDLFHEKFHTKTSAIDFDKNRLDKYYNKLHREKLEGYETSIPGSKFYPYDLNLSKEYMKSKFDTYAKNLQIQTDKGGMPDKVFIEYSAKMISTSYMKSKCAYEILKIKVNYIAKNKEYSEFLAEYENDLALNKQALEKLRKFQIDTIEFLKKKGVNPNEYQFNKNVLGDVDADILFDK